MLGQIRLRLQRETGDGVQFGFTSSFTKNSC
jgi:hypothetical protein